MKPLCKWSGGKGREISLFKKYYPKHFSLYIEPFVGGGAVFFDTEPINAVISDTHKNLINFYQQIKNGNAKKIYDLMSENDNVEDVYYYIRDKYEPKNNMEKAFKFFYLRKTCYRGMLRYNKSGKFNVPYGWYKTYNFDILLDRKYESLLKDTIVFNKSFEFLFRNYNNNNNFVFLDPPYDSTFKNYGFSNFGKQKHLSLFNCFKKTKNKCLLIIGKTDFIYNLYKDYIIGEYNKKYAFKIHSGRIGDEINNLHLIVKNY